MKPFILKNSILPIMIVVTLFSCQNEELLQTKEVQPDIQLVEISNDSQVQAITPTSEIINCALKFSSETVYRNTLSKMERMSSSEKLQYADRLGLKSLRKLLNIADAELDSIAETAIDENDFRAKYAQYKSKYSTYFVGNSVDATDLSLYVPDGDEILSYLVGTNYSIVIGDEVKKIKYTQNMSERDKRLFGGETSTSLGGKANTRALPPMNTWYENSFVIRYQEDDSKKIAFKIERDGISPNVIVDMGTQKKMWYGWRRDTNRHFFFRFALDNFEYVFSGAAGQPVWSNSPEYLYQIPPHIAQGDYKFRLGRFRGNSPVTGAIYIWTDFTAEHDSRGELAFEVIGNQAYVKCLNNNSQPCRANIY